MRYQAAKTILSQLGVWVPPAYIHLVNGALNCLHVGRWMHDRGLNPPVRSLNREELYQTLYSTLKEPVSYLEFGVFQGASIRFWSNLLTDNNSRMDGFDSFEGLPENWGLQCPKNTFDTRGVIPVIDDPRVHLHKGWFRDSVPSFLSAFRPHNSLVLHLDADLYSSTAFILKQVQPFLRSGTLLIFDEFSDREHELKAFEECLTETKMVVKCVGATKALTQVAFCVEKAPEPSHAYIE
jgi:hypothetical protein